MERIMITLALGLTSYGLYKAGARLRKDIAILRETHRRIDALNQGD